MAQIGEKVGAILGSNDDETIEFFGYGVYECDAIPEEAVGYLAEIVREAKIESPKIKLDSGKVVYGCECWWGSEEHVKEELSKYKKVIDVDIDEVRKKF